MRLISKKIFINKREIKQLNKNLKVIQASSYRLSMIINFFEKSSKLLIFLKIPNNKKKETFIFYYFLN